MRNNLPLNSSLLYFKNRTDLVKFQLCERCTCYAIVQERTKFIPGNYRPVSLKSDVCKCMGKNVRASVIEHLARNNLMSNAQFGFV